MVEILPLNENLGEIVERNHFEVTFSVRYDQTDPSTKYETKSLTITKYDANTGVVVDEATISGEYRDSFSLGSDSLKYVNKDRTFGTAGGFDQLPDPTTADLYSFTAPDSLREVYSYQVTLVYTETVSSSSGGSEKESGTETTPPTVTEKTIIKNYTHTVLGSWDAWAEQLRDYVKRGVHRGGVIIQ